MSAGIALSAILPSAAADLQDPPENEDGTADWIPVRLRARCASQPSVASRPGSSRGFSLRRNSVIGKIANAMPQMPGNKAQVLLARVCQEEESFVCYRAPSASSPLSRSRSPAAGREKADSDLELVLRVPLCCALVALVGDTAVTLTMPAQDLVEKLRGLRKPACELFSTLKGQPQCDQPSAPQSWTWECKTPEAASLLLERLQAAGCIVQGLQRRYQLMEVIGNGSFGVVLKAEDRHTGTTVAIKVFTKEYDEKLMHPLLEATILRSHHHESILEILGVYAVTEQETLDMLGVELPITYAIVSEFLAGGELLEHLQRSKWFSEDAARCLAKQLLSAICRLHEGSIVHRDIKLENLILTGTGNALKLIDFGLSALVSDREAMSMKAGSPGYIAPEVLSEPLTCKADCFSTGVILYILLTGETPFPGKNANEVLVKNMRCQVNMSPLAKVSAEAKDLVMGLLRKNQRERLSAAAALDHVWFTQPATPAAPVAPATPRTGPAAPRGRHLPGLRTPQHFITRRSPETCRAAALTRRPDATPAVELDLGESLPHNASVVRRRVLSPESDRRPSPTATPRATGASAARALAASAVAAAAVPPRQDWASGGPSAAAANACAPPEPQRKGFCVSVAPPSTADAAPHLLDGGAECPPQRNTSPAPAVERFTMQHGRMHEALSASRHCAADAAPRSSSARPVQAWSKQAVPDRVSFVERAERPSFRTERPSFHSEAPSHVRKARKLPRPEEKSHGLFAVTPHASAPGQEGPVVLLADPDKAGIGAGLARVRLPTQPPPMRYRRPVGLQHHRLSSLQRS
ncbi:unnamed protein product [Prorocentrum cordatum]|uniref:Protein kinase domain-containing protein n=1 Tax=Prorocentrum cordatum TaxID=2364126 RepID=A0ABN9TWS0_9DINO|nr:unnamed protein product [Polarella glacialis]